MIKLILFAVFGVAVGWGLAIFWRHYGVALTRLIKRFFGFFINLIFRNPFGFMIIRRVIGLLIRLILRR